MIQPNELRIGNYVYDTLGQPDRLSIRGMMYVLKEPTNNQLEPIPITEEWLKDFGFQIRPYGFYFNGIVIRESIKGKYEIRVSDYAKYIVITKVHQLQNLYFSLVGKELEKI